MAIPPEDLQKARTALDESVRPVFFFDDDPDGLCSFLLLYRHKREGKGVIVKSAPELSARFAQAAKDYDADVVFVLDKPMVEQEFFDDLHVPVYWIDHHKPVERKKVRYLNPRLADDADNRSTTYWAWEMVKDSIPQDIWIAAAGVVSDWQIPDFREELEKAYPGLLPDKVTRPEDALYSTKIGLLARILAFNLKGTAKDSMTSAKILTRVKDAQELLGQRSAQARFIYKRYQQIQHEYEHILRGIKVGKGKLLVHIYSAANTALTGNLSNELLYKYPHKVILIARLNEGKYMCSLRADARYSNPIDTALREALEGIRGTGGGHAYACGGSIDELDFDRFITQFEKALGKHAHKKEDAKDQEGDSQ